MVNDNLYFFRIIIKIYLRPYSIIDITSLSDDDTSDLAIVFLNEILANTI